MKSCICLSGTISMALVSRSFHIKSWILYLLEISQASCLVAWMKIRFLITGTSNPFSTIFQLPDDKLSGKIVIEIKFSLQFFKRVTNSKLLFILGTASKTNTSVVQTFTIYTWGNFPLFRGLRGLNETSFLSNRQILRNIFRS